MYGKANLKDKSCLFVFNLNICNLKQAYIYIYIYIYIYTHIYIYIYISMYLEKGKDFVNIEMHKDVITLFNKLMQIF